MRARAGEVRQATRGSIRRRPPESSKSAGARLRQLRPRAADDAGPDASRQCSPEILNEPQERRARPSAGRRRPRRSGRCRGRMTRAGGGPPMRSPPAVRAHRRARSRRRAARPRGSTPRCPAGGRAAFLRAASRVSSSCDLCERLQHDREREVRDPLAVGDAAALEHRGTLADDAHELDGRAATCRRPPHRGWLTTLLVRDSSVYVEGLEQHLPARASGRRSVTRAVARAPGASGARSTTRYADTGSDLPFSSSGSSSSTVIASRTSRYVASPITISPRLRALLEPGGHVDHVARRRACSR